MSIKIEVDDDCADRIVVKALRRSMESAKFFLKSEPEYVVSYLAACKVVIEHFVGKP